MKKIFYYILVDPDKTSHTKVGITKNLDQRIKAYRTAAPNCYFLSTYPIDSTLHERRILDLLKDRFRVQSEYVHCNPQIVKNIVEGYFLDISEGIN